MNTLKQVIHYPDTNSVEATWVDENDVVIKCHSYADVQMPMFRDDVAVFGGEIAEYEELIALVESNIKVAEPRQELPTTHWFAHSLPVASCAGDAEAATAGVEVGGLYHTAGTVRVRLA